MLYEVWCSSSNRGPHVAVHSLSPLLLSTILASVRGRRRTGRSGKLSEFWLPVKRSRRQGQGIQTFTTGGFVVSSFPWLQTSDTVPTLTS
jgi:predicted sugar kinase